MYSNHWEILKIFISRSKIVKIRFLLPPPLESIYETLKNFMQ